MCNHIELYTETFRSCRPGRKEDGWPWTPGTLPETLTWPIEGGNPEPRLKFRLSQFFLLGTDDNKNDLPRSIPNQDTRLRNGYRGRPSSLSLTLVVVTVTRDGSTEPRRLGVTKTGLFPYPVGHQTPWHPFSLTVGFSTEWEIRTPREVMDGPLPKTLPQTVFSCASSHEIYMKISVSCHIYH